MPGKPLIRVWRRDGFTLKIFDLQKQDGYGKWMLAYKFYDNGIIIFQGEDYCCSPMRAVDSAATVYGLLSFFSLRPGDVENDCFKDYTKKQIEWRDSGRSEELGFIVAMEEERLAKRSK